MMNVSFAYLRSSSNKISGEDAASVAKRLENTSFDDKYFHQAVKKREAQKLDAALGVDSESDDDKKAKGKKTKKINYFSKKDPESDDEGQDGDDEEEEAPAPAETKKGSEKLTAEQLAHKKFMNLSAEDVYKKMETLIAQGAKLETAVSRQLAELKVSSYGNKNKVASHAALKLTLMNIRGILELSITKKQANPHSTYMMQSKELQKVKINISEVEKVLKMDKASTAGQSALEED